MGTGFALRAHSMQHIPWSYTRTIFHFGLQTGSQAFVQAQSWITTLLPLPQV
jgi:hypothetical protein